MFSHIMVGSNNIEKAKAFYRQVLGALGYEMAETPDGRAFFMGNHSIFAVGAPIDGQSATYANGGTIGFSAKDTAQIDAFHAAGCGAGGSCEGAPGRRQNSQGVSYAAYLRDPDGNKLCAVLPLAE